MVARMEAERRGPLDEESCRQRLLREWLELEERYDRELARRLFDSRGHKQPCTCQRPGLEIELNDLAQAVRRAKAAYEATRNSQA